ncbi:hypothetical protein Landi51_02831 [Colletotrichum acutatum]
MDPLTAIGLVANILAFVDFGLKGLTEEAASLQRFAEQTRHFADDLQTPDPMGLDDDEKVLCALAKYCCKICEDILTLIDGIRPKKAFSGIQAINLRDSIKDDIQKLVRIPERSLERLAQGSILRGLEFDTMYYRHDTICEAHEKPFRWILADDFDDRCNVDCPNGRQNELLSDSGTGVIKDMKLKVDITSALAEENPLVICTEGDEGHFPRLAREISHDPDQIPSPKYLPTSEERRDIQQKLTQWLSSGSGVFHFSAKIGAGKSTLMKIIINHGESRKRRNTWTGDKTLVCAKFFFWNSGSERQRPISGLYLGLLHEVLSAHPDLTTHALPSFWEAVYTSPSPAGERMHISPSQSLQGLDRLFQGSGISQNYGFCLFIHGLDELQETTECSDIKFCVASRPLNAFLKMSAPQQSICLHDLSKRDMALYIDEKLQNIEDANVLASISKVIFEKAQVIFFWAAIVVKDIRGQIVNRHDLESLIRHINQLPEEINDLFAHILQSLTPKDRRRAYQVLAVLLRAQTYQDQ